MNFYNNAGTKLSRDLFKSPTSEYRAAPFWAWNCKLDEDLLMREIDYLKDMGMGGFHIHSRTGMSTPYLSEEFMNLVKACNEKAKASGMLCWLYDEDRWPSGSAGGFVTQDIRYRSRYLVFTPNCNNENYKLSRSEFDNAVENNINPKGYFISKYQIKLKNGYLDEYKRLSIDEKCDPDATLWYAYMEIASESPWFNNQTYVNTLNPEAIKKFIEITHEKYYSTLGDEFGKSIPAIFTDEPQFERKQTLRYANEQENIILPYTDDFDESYKEVYGVSLLDYLPELFWEIGSGEVSVARYRYHDHLAERFSSAFADTIGNWCKEHGIMLTGHMMEEPSLHSQTAALGEAMRSYRAFQLPGVDMLCDGREYTTVKQAQSAANQYGCPGVSSELYGVTNWDFDFKGHKLGGDWQAALGVTTRVHHLTWVSMGGEAKRDFPACIGYQSPWYREYSMIEDHFARINTALTRGKPNVRVGIIHPIESYWLYWGPNDQTFSIREELDQNFNNIVEWMLFGLIDFDFIAESLLPSLCATEISSSLQVGQMKYDAIVVPACHTLRSSTLERLEAFTAGGGKVIFAGEPANMVDAKRSDRAIRLSQRSKVVPYSRSSLLNTLANLREIDILKEDGSRADNLFHRMRVDGQDRWLFICHVNPVPKTNILNQIFNMESSSLEKIKIKIKGQWKPIVYNTMDGSINPCQSVFDGSETIITHDFYIHDSLLLKLEQGNPDSSDSILTENRPEYKYAFDLSEPLSITLSEPNALLLDMAEYSFDDGDWIGTDEVLRIDNEFRKHLGFRQRTDATEQPWLDQSIDKHLHTLHLKFSINSEIEVKNPLLALENAENTRIVLNGNEVCGNIQGWYVDEAIKTLELPTLPAGKNELILHIPFGVKTNVEWCYLLGDFGVQVTGRYAKIIEAPKSLVFSDWTQQGLPFYAGNITYHCPIDLMESNVKIEIPQFKNTLVSVELDGESKGNIAFEPYCLDLGHISKGRHILGLTAYGNRFNAFGAVHNCAADFKWHGPNSWRTTGIDWSYQYQLKPMGILTNPRIWLKV